MDNKFYVYCYYDPRKSPPEPFYIGKGCDDRYKNHLKEAKNGKIHPKCQKIQAIWNSGLEPIIEIIDNNLIEKVAYELEIFLISEIGSKFCSVVKNGPLTNFNPGGEGARLFGEMNGMYGKTHTQSVKDSISKQNSNRLVGKLNPNHKSKVNIKKRKKRYNKWIKTILNKYSNIKKIKYYRNKIKKTRAKYRNIEESNKLKGRPGLSNGRATFFLITSPDNKEYLVSLLSGLKDFCITNDLPYNIVYKYRKDNIKIPKRYSHDTNFDSEYIKKREKVTGYKIQQMKRIKIEL